MYVFGQAKKTSNNNNSGISNATKAFYINSLRSESTLVIRMNGEGTDDFLDREHELEAYDRLSRGAICPPLIAKFNNGIVMSLVEGIVFTGETVKIKHNAKLTAHEVARMHRNVVLKDNEKSASLVDSVKHFLSLVQHHTIDHSNGEYILRKLPSPDNSQIMQFFEEDFQYATKLINQQKSPLVVCHNDLLLANFLHDEKANKVTIIDYEYLAPNPAAFDLANHFNEYAGTEEVSHLSFMNISQFLQLSLMEHIATKNS